MDKAQRMEIATTIIEQLGGRRFTVMTGAKQFVAIDSGVLFSLPSNFAKNGINKVRITLTSDDLYNVEYLRTRGTSIKEIAKSEGLYSDMLQRDFTAETGLDTRL